MLTKSTIFRLSGMALFLYSLFFASSQVEGAIPPKRWVRKCGQESKTFLRWYCKDSSFVFPFPFRQVHVVLRYPAPRKELFPFQHQASECCKRGCQESGYIKMCWYHNILKHCERHNNHHTKEGRQNRANCLLKLEKVKRSYEVEQIPRLTKTQIASDLALESS
ncbi:uncharacterized protein LOC120341590 isoform X1 [Styela clava]